MGLRLNMAVFEIFECVEPLRMTRVQTFLLEFDEPWVTLSDQCRNHDFKVINQSINQRTECSNNSTTQYQNVVFYGCDLLSR